MTDTPITIYLNPACGSSQRALAMIRASGAEPVVVDYLTERLSRERLLELIAALGLTPRELLRRKNPLCAELDLDGPGWTDDELVDLMVAEPNLIARPIVEAPQGARLCRPPEVVLELLRSPPGAPGGKGFTLAAP